jgi:hypothetical protein
MKYVCNSYSKLKINYNISFQLSGLTKPRDNQLFVKITSREIDDILSSIKINDALSNDLLEQNNWILLVETIVEQYNKFNRLLKLNQDDNLKIEKDDIVLFKDSLSQKQNNKNALEKHLIVCLNNVVNDL